MHRISQWEEGKVFTSGLDVFDVTPLLGIKQYIKDLDAKSDANYGWIEERNKQLKMLGIKELKGED